MTQSPAQMRAAAIDEFGGPITAHTVPVPRPGPDEILIRVESAGIGVWDTFEAEGGFAKMMGTQPSFPYVLGTDGAGTVAEVGAAVRDFKKGDKVYAMALANPKGGFYAEYAAVPAAYASRIPAGLQVEQAGVMPVDAITALVGLDDVLGLKSGESILIFGASGGIGHLAVQLAKRMGARVLAVASGNDGVDLVKGLGADQVIDGHRADIPAAARAFAPDGLDCILLTAGGPEAEKAIEALSKGGRVAYPNGVEPAPKARAGAKIQSYDGVPKEGTIAKLNRLIEQGPFKVHVARMFSLDEADAAHKALRKHYLGKLAMHPA
ncbi:MAG TPA: NADP-dependent oxidoreductase [Tepidisphaeraceae bacterium]|nr:NADP-dependent oxidoreductase [Tepidisphaeraceae bacterium]